MNARRAVIAVTATVVVVVAVVLTVLRWDDANKLASALSALAGLAAVGVGVLAVLPASSRSRIRVSRTGKAVAGPGGTATSSMSGKLPEQGTIQVDHTGEADASQEATSPPASARSDR